MGSRLTRPVVQQRWPRNAEAARRRCYDLAGDARELLAGLLREETLLRNRYLAEAQIAYVLSMLSDMQRELVEARIGIDPPEEDHDAPHRPPAPR